MRHALLIAMTAVAGLGACAPIAGDPYGYAPAPAYGYYNGGYAPGPYYAEPGYAAPGAAIIVGGERRYEGDRDRYRYERPRNDGYRGNPYVQRERDVRPERGGRNDDGRRGISPVAASRPAPAPTYAPPRPQPGPVPNGGFNPANPTAQGDRQ